jgi:hypothetical protein
MSDSLLEFLDQQISAFTDIPEKTKEEPAHDLNSLVELIDREVGRLSTIIQEKDEGLNVEEAYQSIPLPTLSEMGWADPSKTGGKIDDAARRELSEYLSPITTGSKNLQQSIQSLQKFINDTIGLPEEELKNMPISQLLSFLVFYKTLTHIIANFNTATAGFLFEALLGVLTGGEQIAAGGDTIADFKYQTGAKNKGGTRWVSLKLLTEKGTTIDGSFRDLINDLADPSKKGGIEYVVTLKDLEGDKDDLAGSLNFYSFTLNRYSLAKFLSTSTQGRKDMQIASPKSRKMLDQETSADTRWAGDYFEWLQIFYDNLEEMATPKDIQRIQDGIDEVVWKWESEYNKVVGALDKLADWGGSRKPKYIARDPENQEEVDRLQQLIYGALSRRGFPKEEKEVRRLVKDVPFLMSVGHSKYGGKSGEGKDPMQVIFNPLLKVFRDIHDEKEGSSKKKIKNPKTGKMVPNPLYRQSGDEEMDARKSSIKLPGAKNAGKHTYMSPEDSKKYLDSLETEEEYWEAIKDYSFGYLKKQQFVITQDEMKRLVDTGPFATLTVGKELIRKALEEMITGVNARMFTIYRTMEALSTHLRGFFMKDMDGAEGKSAKESAQKVASETDKLITEHGSE